jgi:anti-sigma regulatory factor (Ser/Thr protein kinase)
LALIEGTASAIRHRLEFSATLAGARVARRSVESILREHAYDGDASVIVILVSELVTNAVMHGHPPFAAWLDLDDGRVHVSVEDGNTERLPMLIREGSDGTNPGGNGLRLVTEFADEWGWRYCGHRGDGTASRKAVWFAVGASKVNAL